MTSRVPDFVIVGAQRAASTYLQACLRGHPELFLCPDEVPFFEDPFFHTTPPSALAAVFAGARPGQRLGIQRPDYLGRPECPAHIHSLAPHARILAVLRDPVARAVSAYCWYVQFGLLPMEPVDDGLGRLLAGWSDPAYPRAGEIVDFGFYGRHLTRYVETFRRDQVLVLLSDDLDGPDGLHRIYSFLDVDPDHRFRSRSRNRPTNAGVYDLRRLRVLRARRRFVWSWDDVTVYRYQPRRRRRPFAFIPNAAVVGFDRVVLARLFGSSPPSLDPELEARLRALYADDVAVLEHLLDRDLSAWRHPPPPPPNVGGLGTL
ncbi:MAG: hypothetical protein ACRD0U_15595, partial [Acidimicrobiales bacterium]